MVVYLRGGGWAGWEALTCSSARRGDIALATDAAVISVDYRVGVLLSAGSDSAALTC